MSGLDEHTLNVPSGDSRKKMFAQRVEAAGEFISTRETVPEPRFFCSPALALNSDGKGRRAPGTCPYRSNSRAVAVPAPFDGPLLLQKELDPPRRVNWNDMGK